MKDELTTGAGWNEAAKAGLYFGAISSAYVGLSELIQMIDGAVLLGFLKTALWAGKLVLCIWLMVFLMKRLTRKFSGVTNADTFRFGARTSLLSALIVASVYAAILILMPEDSISSAFDQATAQITGQLDSNSLAMLDTFKENMPTIIFFSQLIYCFTFGLILSLIVSRSIPSRNPFARDFNGEEPVDEQDSEETE